MPDKLNVWALIALGFMNAVLIVTLNFNQVSAYDNNECSFIPQITQLPNDIKPIHYDVFISISDDGTKYVGQVKIILESRPLKTYFILMNSGPDINISRLKVFNMVPDIGEDELTVKCSRIDPVSEIMMIEFESEVSISPMFTVTINFDSPIGTSQKGLFALQENSIFISRFEPYYTRYLMPCFDETHFKATFKISLETEDRLKCFFITEQESLISSISAPGRSIVEFEQTDIISPHQLSLVIGEFKAFWDFAQDGLRVSFYGRPTARRALIGSDSSLQALRRIRNYFGTPYPKQKIDVFELGSWSQATHPPSFDNLGIIILFTVSNTIHGSTYNVDFVKAVSRHYLLYILNIELPQDYWLLDGLSGWLAIDGIDYVNGLLTHRGNILVNQHRNALEYYLSDKAQPILNLDQEFIGDSLNEFQYSKTVAMFANLARVCSEDTWKSILIKLAQERLNPDEATNMDLVERITTACHFNAKNLLVYWLVQPGIQMVNVASSTRSHLMVKKEVILTTSEPGRVLINYSIDISIPLNLIIMFGRANDTRLKRVHRIFRSIGLIEGPPNVDLIDGLVCVKANRDGAGFYLVRYSDDLIHKFKIGCDINSSLTVLDRGSLLFESIQLFKVGLVDINYLIEFIIVLHKDNNWYNIHLLHSNYMFARKVIRGDASLKEYIDTLGLHLFERIRLDTLYRLQPPTESQRIETAGDLAQILIILNSKPTLAQAGKFVQDNINNLASLQSNNAIIQPVLYILAKQGNENALMNLPTHFPDLYIGRALGSMTSMHMLHKAWLWLIGFKRSDDATIGFIEQALDSMEGRMFLSKYLSDETSMTLLITSLGSDGAEKLLKEVCVMPQDSHFCFMNDTTKLMFSPEEWSRIENEIEELRLNFSRLNLTDLQAIKNTIIEFINTR